MTPLAAVERDSEELELRFNDALDAALRIRSR